MQICFTRTPSTLEAPHTTPPFENTYCAKAEKAPAVALFLRTILSLAHPAKELATGLCEYGSLLTTGQTLSHNLQFTHLLSSISGTICPSSLSVACKALWEQLSTHAIHPVHSLYCASFGIIYLYIVDTDSKLLQKKIFLLLIWPDKDANQHNEYYTHLLLYAWL